MESSVEMLHEHLQDEECLAELEAAWRASIQARVDGIRSGTGNWRELKEVLAELDRIQAELVEEDPDDGAEDDDPVEVEAAWAAEIERRVNEIRNGTAKTYAAEDVIAAMRLRFG